MDDFVTITCLPSGRRVRARRGIPLMDAVKGGGLPVGSSCDGDGVCARCGLRVLAGADALSPEDWFEADLKARNRVAADLRISCQARILGDVTVTADYW